MVQNAHLGRTDADIRSTESMPRTDSVSDEDDVEPDDIRSETSTVDGLPPVAGVTSCLNSADLQSMQTENWVTAVAALHNTDLVVSGKNFLMILVISC